MRYFKVENEGCILMIGYGFGGEEISEDEYYKIYDVINNKPIANDGYYFLLKNDLQWEERPISEIDSDE